MRGDGRNQLQIPAPLPLKNIFRMIPLSARSVSLDSPFIFTIIRERKDNVKGVHYWKNSNSGLVAAHYGKNSGSGIADQREAEALFPNSGLAEAD